MQRRDMKDEDRVSNQNPIFAVLDAHAKNAANKLLYNDAEVAVAEDLYDTAKQAFYRKNVYLNYRIKNITIKINKPDKGDRISLAVVELEKNLIEQNVRINIEKNGNRIYHLPRLNHAWI